MLSLRETLIRAFFRTRGAPRVVNGVSLRVAPAVRARFTPDYDRPLADFLRSRVRVGDEVWNVGANVGIWTLQMASWVGSTGTVVAFEPNPATVAVLRHNIRLNGLESGSRSSSRPLANTKVRLSSSLRELTVCRERARPIRLSARPRHSWSRRRHWTRWPPLEAPHRRGSSWISKGGSCTPCGVLATSSAGRISWSKCIRRRGRGQVTVGPTSSNS